MKMDSVASVARIGVLFLIAIAAPAPARAAASLEAWAGVVGGAGTGSIPDNCTTFGAPVELAPMFGSGSLGMQVLGGNAACGYSGGWTDLTAASGPLPNNASLAPVILGNPGFSGYFDGNSSSSADYGVLATAAHANISGGTPGSPVALFDSQGASFFDDTLTLTSPQLSNGTTAYVRYRFTVSGSFSALGAPAPYFFGSTYGQLALTINNGSVYGIVSANLTRGGQGTVNGAVPPAGWTTSTGALSGSSVFDSLQFPVTVGQPWDLRVGLIGWAYGTADTTFFDANLIEIDAFDSQLVPVSHFSVQSASGTQYAPEPSTELLMLTALLSLSRMRRRGGGSKFAVRDRRD